LKSEGQVEKKRIWIEYYRTRGKYWGNERNETQVHEIDRSWLTFHFHPGWSRL